ncbi:MAG: inositol monophosphatase family protein [Candidatus Limivicinus sp.]
MTNQEILNAMIGAQREAAALILQAHGVLAETKTGHRDVVTEYDRQVQALLTERLSAAVPGSVFFCEENEQQGDLKAEHVFIIDPIDGTMNFVRGFHHSAISVAYMRSGVIRAASVYNPYAEECFSALAGEGAWCNGRGIRAGELPLAESVVCCGTAPYSPQLADSTFALMKKAFLASLDIRREGSAALDMCSAAAGRAGVYFEPSVSLWDIAAGLLLVQEAGGVCCRLDGSPIPLDGSKTSILAGGRQAVADFLKLV